MQTLSEPTSRSQTRVRVAAGWSAVARSHIGHVRERNEDHFVISAGHGLCAVADGLGGGPAGDVASRLACEALLSAMVEGATNEDALARAFAAADHAVLEAGRTDPALSGMATTLSAIWFRDPGVAEAVRFAHVGDSRIYVLRPTAFEQITQDDTTAMDWVRRGQMTLAEAKRSYHWHMLTQSIGGDAPIRPQIGEVDLATADAVLLCSDGLTAMVREAELEEILRASLQVSASDPAVALVEAALSNGGADNVTVIVLSRTG